MTDEEREKQNRGIVLGTFMKITEWIGRTTSIFLGFYFTKDYKTPILSEKDIARSIRRVDYFNIAWWLIISIGYVIIVMRQGIIRDIVLFIVIVRMINIISYLLRTIFTITSDSVVSAKRNLLYALINYIELIICFATIYARFSDHLDFDRVHEDKLVYLYFSNISQLTIGYGDVCPQGFLRFIVASQGMVGLLIVSLTIGKYVGLMPMKDGIKQPEESNK